MPTAYSYCRFSQSSQLFGDSLRRQLQLSEAYAARHGLTIDTTLHLRDLGVSAFRGKNVKEGALAGFMEAIRLGRVKRGSFLLLESLDRLSRDEVGEALGLFLDIIRSGVKIVTLVSPEQEFSKASINDPGNLFVAIGSMLRAHEESAMKSHRLSKAWEQKKKNAATKPVTGQVPAWIELVDGEFRLMKESAATVKLIFRLALDGHGISAITRYLNVNSIPPIGKTKRASKWGRSYIQRILTNRACIGEYQPHKGRVGNRVPCGPAILKYYPAVVSESIFYKVQAARKPQKQSAGRPGKSVANLFTSLIFDASDNATMVVVNKGNNIRHYLVSSKAMVGVPGSVYRSFPYQDFENAFLIFVSELKVADVLPVATEKNTAEDQLEAEEAKLVDIDARLKAVKKRVSSDPNIEALMDVLTELSNDRKATAGRVERLKAELSEAGPTVTLTDTKHLIDLMKKTEGDALTDLRTRLKSVIRRLVASIHVRVVRTKSGNNGTSLALAQVEFATGTIRRIYIPSPAVNKAGYVPITEPPGYAAKLNLSKLTDKKIVSMFEANPF